jgi:hypothetical protein
MLRNQKPQYDRLPGYGWTVLGVDAANVGVHLGLLAATNGTHTIEGSLPYSFVTVYLLSGPIIHGAHGRWGHAAGSLGLRVGLPLVLGLAGSWLFSGPPCTEEEKLNDSCDTNALEAVGFIFGGLAGVGTAMVLDAALLARGDRVLRNPQPTPDSFAPWLDSKRQLAGVQWLGRF